MLHFRVYAREKNMEYDALVDSATHVYINPENPTKVCVAVCVCVGASRRRQQRRNDSQTATKLPYKPPTRRVHAYAAKFTVGTK